MDTVIWYYSHATGGFYCSDLHVNIPEDAVEISADKRMELYDGLSQNRIVIIDSAGIPQLADRPALAGNALVQSEIASLEASITPRRIRESVLGLDNGWLKNINDQITSLRAQLKQ